MRSKIEDDFSGFMISRWPRLLRTAHMLTGNHHDAEELAQGALARTYVKWEQVRSSEDMDAYVWRIMIHCNADRFRRRRVREWITTHLPDAQVADPLVQTEHRDVLLRALTRLPIRQRTAVVLCYFEDLSHAQAAAVLGIRASTVRSQVSRALEKLREDPALIALADPPANSQDRGGLATEEEGAVR